MKTSDQFWSRLVTTRSEPPLIFRMVTNGEISFLENPKWNHIPGSIYVWSVDPELEPKVLHKSKEPPNTDCYDSVRLI